MKKVSFKRYRFLKGKTWFLYTIMQNVYTSVNTKNFNKNIYLYTLAPSGPPLNIRTTSRSVSSLFFTWDPPDTTKQNGVIISYTACVSHSENEPCFQTFTTSERNWLVGNLNSSTKYYVRVLASTKVGGGNYSESEGFFTNGSKHNTSVVYISIFL